MRRIVGALPLFLALVVLFPSSARAQAVEVKLISLETDTGCRFNMTVQRDGELNGISFHWAPKDSGPCEPGEAISGTGSMLIPGADDFAMNGTFRAGYLDGPVDWGDGIVEFRMGCPVSPDVICTPGVEASAGVPPEVEDLMASCSEQVRNTLAYAKSRGDPAEMAFSAMRGTATEKLAYVQREALAFGLEQLDSTFYKKPAVLIALDVCMMKRRLQQLNWDRIAPLRKAVSRIARDRAAAAPPATPRDPAAPATAEAWQDWESNDLVISCSALIEPDLDFRAANGGASKQEEMGRIKSVAETLVSLKRSQLESDMAGRRGSPPRDPEEGLRRCMETRRIAQLNGEVSRPESAVTTPPPARK